MIVVEIFMLRQADIEIPFELKNTKVNVTIINQIVSYLKLINNSIMVASSNLKLWSSAQLQCIFVQHYAQRPQCAISKPDFLYATIAYYGRLPGHEPVVYKTWDKQIRGRHVPF